MAKNLIDHFIDRLQAATELPPQAFYYFRLHYLTDVQRTTLDDSAAFAVAVTIDNEIPIRVQQDYGEASNANADLIIDALAFEDRPKSLRGLVQTMRKSLYDLSLLTPSFGNSEVLGGYPLLGMAETSVTYRYNANDKPTASITYNLELQLSFDT